MRLVAVLAETREKARACRSLLCNGIDPLADRREKASQQRAAELRTMTFEECASAYIQAHAPNWKNAKHKMQWRATLTAYAYPVFGNSVFRT